MNWLLPENLADALPQEAAQIEALRRLLLDHFRASGYELVIPPLLEYLESLLTGAGRDLNLATCKLADQFSGRTLGVRADMTPQAARIDAHLLNRVGATRLCYCGSTLRARPASLVSSREPIQIGAELYGYAGVAADREILRLLLRALQLADLPDFRLTLGHVGIFRALVETAGLDAEAEAALFSALRGKDEAAIGTISARFAPPLHDAIQALPRLYGDITTLDVARKVLPALPVIDEAITVLATLAAALPEVTVRIDLSDLRGYHYHNGVVFTAYAPGYPAAIALGGRYDGVGKSFGRSRPATGFSLDLRELARLARSMAAPAAILAPALPHPPELAARIRALREAGEIVVERLPDEAHAPDPRCDRQLVAMNGKDWGVAMLDQHVS
jgi:ATP phosphoribosyltransferase regulatory subunit